MPLPDRTKSSFKSIAYPGNPDIDPRWGNVQLDSEAIQCVGNQFAGPGATWMEQDEASTGRLDEGHQATPQKLPRPKKYQ